MIENSLSRDFLGVFVRNQRQNQNAFWHKFKINETLTKEIFYIYKGFVKSIIFLRRADVCSVRSAGILIILLIEDRENNKTDIYSRQQTLFQVENKL